VIDGENVFVTVWSAKPKYRVIVQDIRLYEYKVEADSPEQAKVKVEQGETGDGKEIGDSDVSVGEIQTADGYTVWERP